MDDSERIRVGRVVTAVDFHESSRDAALWAIRHFAPGAEHHLLHVVEIPELPAPLRPLGPDREQLRLAARGGAQRRLEELRDLAGARARVEIHVAEGKPATVITGFAEEIGADLVVVGEQGPTRGVAALLGSTAERVLIQSRIPVLVARKVADAPPRHLLVAIDPSEVAGQVLAWAGSLLARFDATATVVNVVDRVLLFDELTGFPSAAALQRLEEEATVAMRGWLDDAIRETGLSASRARAAVLVGDPSYEINAEAARRNADLVLLGSLGGDVAWTPLIGRIVNKVVRSAPCSVLVVPRGGAARVSSNGQSTGG
jgi:nucleotide-binding universal stress UspA family protein